MRQSVSCSIENRATFDPVAACPVVWWSRSGMIRITGVELKPAAPKSVYLFVL
jgi:hypothetical protein